MGFILGGKHDRKQLILESRSNVGNNLEQPGYRKLFVTVRVNISR